MNLSHPASTVASMDELTDLEQKILAFEARRWNHQGAKDEAALKEFGLTPARYHQTVLTIIDKPAALVTAPMLVLRLRRLRRTRQAARSG